MTRRSCLIAPCLLLAASTAFGARSSMNDYVQGMQIVVPPGRPLVEATLPDSVYRTVTRTDLGDLRVFNAEGLAVPHALCAAPETSAAVVSERSLPVFELREARGRRVNGSRVEVETAGGTRVKVQDARSDSPAAANARTHIIDARDVDESIRAIQFDWQSPDGASEAKVRIEASDDLDRWTVLVPATTLLLVTRSGQELRRERVELPQRSYEYLRVHRADGGSPLLIRGVTAEHVSAAPDIEPLWFLANSAGPSEPDALLFDSARLAPVRYARLNLPFENSSVRVRLQSRPDEQSTWRERWQGEMYRVAVDSQLRTSPPARFEPTTDRYWRVQISKQAEPYLASTLELGYRPQRLRFLTQGSSPFTLAFGSRRAEIVAPASCDGLLEDIGATQRANLTSEGYPGGVRVLGGERALRPLPVRTPLRLVVLWSVLIVGVALLVGMALSLLKRLRT